MEASRKKHRILETIFLIGMVLLFYLMVFFISKQ